MRNELFDICGKVFVITGGTGVLGSGIAAYLANEGARVVILGRKVTAGRELVATIEAAGGKAMFLSTDVTNRELLESNRNDILEAYGCIDVLINAAGGNLPGATIMPGESFFSVDMNALREVVELNLFGTMLPTQVFGEAMVLQKGRSIINFSSESALRPLTQVMGYGVAKAAIVNYTKSLATELALKFGNDLRVNAIVPGFFLTEQNRMLLTKPDGSHSDRAKSILAHTPFHCFGKPEDLFGAVHYLASNASKFVTGTVLVVDGGFDAFSI